MGRYVRARETQLCRQSRQPWSPYPYRTGCAEGVGDSVGDFVGDSVGDTQKPGEKP